MIRFNKRDVGSTKLIVLFLAFFLSQSVFLSAAAPDNIVFVNTGRMNIAAKSTGNPVSLYVPDAMRQLSRPADSVKVVLNGIVELGGNFYQDAITPVFNVGAPGDKTLSTGKIRFVSNRSTKRYVTTNSVNITQFNRSQSYIAFPNIEIDTNDTIILPPKMGIDARSLYRTVGKSGALVLSSNEINSQVFNASLRFPFSGSSQNLVSNGAVVVEQYVRTYRNGTQLFAFASPFLNTQLSGYFAGNWVRKPASDGNWGHTAYVLGNKTSQQNSSLIDLSQYVTNPLETLVAGQAYLVKPRPAGFNYAALQTANGLMVTGASASVYDKDKFVFDGKVYTLPAYNEQLFAQDLLFTKTIPQGTFISSTVNWLIGNSYTSPISTKLLANAMNQSGLKFSPVIYIFPAGSTSYQPYDITGTGDAISVTNISEIPAMSVFMLRLSKGQTVNATTTFSIGKSLLMHGNIAHGASLVARQNETGVKKDVLIRLSPLSNDNIYDLAAVGFRDSAALGTDKYDIPKVYNPGSEGFQLFCLSESNARLSANGVPDTTSNISIGIKPAQVAEAYKLTFSGVENLSCETVLLYDLLTGSVTDLQKANEYVFQMQPDDIQNRFKLIFKHRLANNTAMVSDLKISVIGQSLKISNLNRSDLGTNLAIYDLQGKQLQNIKIGTYPDFTALFAPAKGIYLVKIQGFRNLTLKLVY